jgi:hypothetical protein
MIVTVPGQAVTLVKNKAKMVVVLTMATPTGSDRALMWR